MNAARYAWAAGMLIGGVREVSAALQDGRINAAQAVRLLDSLVEEARQAVTK